FFSSRRRHTRSYGDWSSDVCSSDLDSRYAKCPQWSSMSDQTFLLLGGAGLVGSQVARAIARETDAKQIIIASLYQREVRQAIARSEERRVGKESRTRRSLDRDKKKI